MATTFIGKDRVRKRFLALPQATLVNLRDAFAKGAQQVVDAQKRAVPVRSGDLQASIEWNWGTSRKVAYSQGFTGKGDLSVRISAGNTKVRYAHIVEFGAAPHVAGGIFKGAAHPGERAQPYFFPPYRANKKSVKARFRRALKKAIADTKVGS